MLLRWIEQARKKPKAVRNRYAFVGAFVITSCITLVWAVSLPSQLAVINADEDKTVPEDSTGAFAKFFSEVKQNFATAYKSKDNAGADSATSTEDTIEPIMIPSLSPDTIEDVQYEYEESLLPEPRRVLIGTTSMEHTNTTNTAE